MNVNLEVVSIPVSDVERALEFYRDRLGWRVDADIKAAATFRVVQITPTGEGHTSIVVRIRHPDGSARVDAASGAGDVRHRRHP